MSGVLDFNLAWKNGFIKWVTIGHLEYRVYNTYDKIQKFKLNSKRACPNVTGWHRSLG